MSETCTSRGPRIGSDGVPVCGEPRGHHGPHRPRREDGWGRDVQWTNTRGKSPATERTVEVPAGKLVEMADTINEVIAHHHQYRELDVEWLAETGRRLRALAAGTDG